MQPQPLAVGQVFESPTKTVNDARVLLISGLAADDPPIHYDVEYARTTRFGKPLAHRLPLASRTPHDDSRSAEGLMFVEQGCRFLGPVVVGDAVHARRTVDRFWEEDRRRFVRFSTELINQRGGRVVAGCHVHRFVPRHSGTRSDAGPST